MEWLKEFLQTYIEDEEKLNSAVEDFSKNHFPKHAMPKGKYNEVAEELKLTKGQLEEQKKSLEDLSKKANTIEEYEAQLEALKQKNTEIEESYKGQISGITKKTELEKMLLSENAHKDAVDLLLQKYIDVVELDDNGAIKDAPTLIEKIKSEKGGLFVTENANSQNKGEGAKAKTPEATADIENRMRTAMGLEPK